MKRITFGSIWSKLRPRKPKEKKFEGTNYEKLQQYRAHLIREGKGPNNGRGC